MVQKDEENVVRDPYADIHAGGFKTSCMLLDFKELLNEELARSLVSSKTTFEMLSKWQKGGVEGREVTPLGYCGNPSNIDLEDAKNFTEWFVKSSASLIINCIK